MSTFQLLNFAFIYFLLAFIIGFLLVIYGKVAEKSSQITQSARRARIRYGPMACNE